MRIRMFILIVLAFFLNSCEAEIKSEVFIRLNQVGFNPNDLKTAIVFSKQELTGTEFKVVNAINKKTSTTGKINNPIGKWGNFDFCYRIDFSKISEDGKYLIEVGKSKSLPFTISRKAFTGIVDSLLKFLKVQRCGATNPILHNVCHIYDSPTTIGDNSLTKIDVTGGWHDAGDYIKFFSTSALTTYLLLFSFDFDNNRFGFDRDNSGAPDILEEARVGLDWLLRCNYAPGKIINQVGDLRDHEVGWRMPENDPLKYERPAYSSIGKNQVGMFVAVMSLASKIWKEKFYDDEFSQRCLKAAESMYLYKDSVPDVDSNYTGMYSEKVFLGKLALGAIELYNTTRISKYLNDAISFGDRAGSDYWWSWGDINSLAHYRIAQHIPRFKDYIKNNLTAFNNNKDLAVFGEGAAFSWGTTNTLLGIALQTILWKKLNYSSAYDSLMHFQRDYVLGKNPWGVSFIYGIGSNYTKNFHNQVGYFNKGYLPGGVAAGPAPKDLLNNYNISRKNTLYDKFNSENVLYFDDREDYITNEPTIVANATAIFVFGYLNY